jgi:hypothetical protein
MPIYEHRPHLRLADRQPPPTVADEHVGVNGRIALAITTAVGTMWCAYAFGLIALIGLPQAIHDSRTQSSPLPIVQWVAQTFLQLVLLSVIIVGQNIQAAASDKRAAQTYQDAEAILHECLELQAHLQAQDAVLERLIADTGGRGGGAAVSPGARPGPS